MVWHFELLGFWGLSVFFFFSGGAGLAGVVESLSM